MGSANKKIFGTDGVRGTANVEPVTAETALKLGRAAGHVFKNLRSQPRGRHKIVLGKDTRLSGCILEPYTPTIASGSGPRPSIKGQTDLSQPPQLPLRHYPSFRRHQIPQTIRRIIAASTILIGIHLQHILRPIRIVLQRRQTFNQSGAPLVEEKPSGHSIGRIAKPVKNLRPPAHTLRVRDLQADTQLRILRRHR